MALLERVSTLLRANINDLLSRAEDPEKLARQLLLDMENQLIQVKTQVAMAIAEQHLLAKKKTDQEMSQSQWMRKAELAVTRQKDDLARAALDRALSHQRMAEALAQQQEDQAAEAETLRSAFKRLEQKLAETQARVDLLTTQLRRSKAAKKMGIAHAILDTNNTHSKLARLTAKVEDAEARNHAARALIAMAASENLDERFASMEKEEQIEALLLELKEKQPLLAEGSDKKSA